MAIKTSNPIDPEMYTDSLFSRLGPRGTFVCLRNIKRQERKLVRSKEFKDSSPQALQALSLPGQASLNAQKKTR